MVSHLYTIARSQQPPWMTWGKVYGQHMATPRSVLGMDPGVVPKSGSIPARKPRFPGIPQTPSPRMSQAVTTLSWISAEISSPYYYDDQDLYGSVLSK